MVIGTGTTEQMLLSSPSFGDEWENTTYNKKFFYNGTIWLVPGEMSQYLNSSGVTLTEGQCVVLNFSTGGVTRTNINFSICVGVVVLGGANNTPVGVAYAGKGWKALVDGAVNYKEYLLSSTILGQWDSTTLMSGGLYLQALESIGTSGLIKTRFLIGESY